MRLKRYLIENRIDIAQTFFFDADLFGITAAHLAKVPVTVASRRNIGHFNDAKSYWLLRRLSGWVDQYLCNSQAAGRMAVEKEGALPQKVRVIYNGLNFARLSSDLSLQREAQRKAWGVAATDILVGLSAHLRHVKNVPSLIQAAARLVPDFPSLKFIVVGEGPLHQELDQMAASLGLGDKFKLVGAVQNIIPCLAAFDIGVLCSHAESFSNALIEYMAAGLPIVASDVGGSGEAITHESTGLLYAPDKAGGLESGLRSLLTDQALGRRLGAAARVAALSRYSLEASVTQHAKFYDELAGTSIKHELSAAQ
jgi:glycosyltransferase involved in cell wall biosynthesis